MGNAEAKLYLIDVKGVSGYVSGLEACFFGHCVSGGRQQFSQAQLRCDLTFAGKEDARSFAPQDGRGRPSPPDQFPHDQFPHDQTVHVAGSGLTNKISSAR